MSDVDAGATTLRSVHTPSFPEVLGRLGTSLLVTTYQAGRLVVLRRDGEGLNTHFRVMDRPMGLAHRDGLLAIGCRLDIAEYRNLPAVCRRLDASPVYPPGPHDACFLPRRTHNTGNVQIHEMAWASGELLFVNTEFSCLAKRSERNSFEPVWLPPFVKGLQPGDCCHLNGLAVRDESVRYVTALGDADTPGGWRATKRSGGVLIDVASGEVMARGLCMPHSPRWHRGRLWVLESGQGTIGTVDVDTGCYEPVASFPGFTRGLAFAGPVAFIGLSQVRETATFAEIPLVERLEDVEQRVCGVWMLNTDTGESLGFCRFEEGVQEVFSVETLPNIRFPDLVNDDPDLISSSYALSNEAFKLVPNRLRS